MVADLSLPIAGGPSGPGFDSTPSLHNPENAGGWGLHPVDELSSRWGIVAERGARVWFEIDR